MALFIIVYVILLPPEEREALIGTAETSTQEQASAAQGIIFLAEYPGKVYSSTKTSQTFSIEPMHLYSKTETSVSDLANSLKVSRNIIKNNFKSVYFNLKDIQKTENADLLFIITESEGEITIKINGHTIYEGLLSSPDFPIKIPSIYLNEGQNVLTFESEFAFLFSNYYLLQNVQLLVTNLEADTKSERTFYIEDISSLRKAKLSYYLTCNNDEDDLLSIYFNNKRIFSDEMFCEYMEKREILLDTDEIMEENTLVFELGSSSNPAKGDYNIDEIKLRIDNSKAGYPSYSFEIDSEQLDKASIIMLSMEFADASSSKKAEVSVNGYEFAIDSSGSTYNKEITNYISIGKNTIRITPENSFEIVSLTVYAK
ncbi:hypothetical protein HZB88_01385 [archaeon]|nr:hypothetical protein [archaeon]